MSHSYSQSPALSNPSHLFLNSHQHPQTQDPFHTIGLACTTSPVSSTYPSAFPPEVPKSLSSDHPSLTSPSPPLPSKSAPPSIPAEPATRPPVPPEPFTPVAKLSSRSRRSTMETPPRQVSPMRRKTESSVASSSPERPPSHTSTFPTMDSPALNVVPATNEDDRLSRDVSPSTHNVLMKRPPTLKEPSSGGLLDPEAHKPPRQSRRLSFFGGMRSRANSNTKVPTPERNDMTAWAMTKDAPQEYNLAYLLNGEKVPELWNESGNVSVYLFPQNESRGPSFKVSGTILTSSEVFREYLVDPQAPNGGRARGRSFGGRNSLAVNDAFSAPIHMPDNQTPLALYIPEASGESSEASTTERLVAIRNMFAMLTGQSLIGTKLHPTPIAALLQVSKMLSEFGYRSLSGESFGEEVDVAFGFYMNSMDLSDMRTSRTRTIEALILAENMRSRELYDDAFAHYAGKYVAIQELQSPLCKQLSSMTLDALARASFDLGKRLGTVNEKLEMFNFPSVFAGVANSTSLEEFQTVDYKTWRRSFERMRTLVLNYYKDRFGNWPPKASSKKNQFTESGLNRLVLKTLYEDMCQIYDLIVDRKSITTRVMDKDMTDTNNEGDPSIVALRRLLSEYDNSSLPVVPPIPYDTPRMPIFTSVSEAYASRSEKQKHRFRKNIKDNELELVLEKSYDFETSSLAKKGNILHEFKHMEFKEAKGKPEAEIQAQRLGYWIFMYCVIQTLPWVVIDAADVKFSEGVEYFLCQPATGNAPWVADFGQVRKQWYITPDGQTVELSADAVKFSTEAVYLRSYCWKKAAEWERMGFEELEPPAELHNITPPGSVHSSSAAPSPVLRPRSHLGSPRMHSAHRSSVAMGIEPISLNDLPPDVMARSNRMSMAFNPRLSMHARSRSVGPSPLQRVSSTPGSQYIDPSVPMPSLPPFMQHSNASGPILRGSSPLGGMRESVYDQPGGGYMNNDVNMSQYPSPLSQEQTATFDDILGVKKPNSSAKLPKKKRSFFFSKPTKA
ncbi:hypothetical protein TD95_003549 [Thielaviopsis punctulata]|uniref:DUF8004 domain-containing protein n=1 Tax=Thielaviopsis punctulata TaxID=72032 RepID=A0A0F4ZFZ2_9PEZI|nr:hypothetical protein TD95_003549 [Thielaviopsis punctulata]